MSDELTIPQPTQQELVAMIHQEFDTAPERLLRDVPVKMQILDNELSRLENMKSNVDPALKAKVARLQKLGFNNTTDSKLLENQKSLDRDKGTHIRFLKNEKSQVHQISDHVAYYQATYRFATFLTVEELTRICETYGLIHAPASTFIGEVPEKNLREIENAQPLKAQDLPDKAIQASGMLSVGVAEALSYVRKLGRPEFRGETIEQLLAYLNRGGSDFNTAGISAAMFSQEWISSPITEPWPNIWEARPRDPSFYIESIRPRDLRRERSEAGKWTPPVFELVEQSHQLAESISTRTFDLAPITGFHIAAPPAMFDLKKAFLVKESKYGYVVKEDPIVFKYCRGGILVYSKWGLEASDPALINPIEN